MQEQEESLLDEDLAGDDMFPRSYVEQLRDEAAKYRTRSADYEQAFSGLSEDEKAYILEGVSLVGENDLVGGGRKLRDAAQVLMADDFYDGLEIQVSEQNQETEGGNAPAPDDIAAIVAQAVEQALAKQAEQFQAQTEEQRAEQQREREVDELLKTIEATGVEPGTDAFRAVLALAEVEAAKDEGPVDFQALADKVKVVYGVESGNEGGEEGGESGDNKLHPPTVDMNSQGSPSGTNEGTFLDKAREAAGENGAVDYMKAAADAADRFFAEQD